MLLQPDWYIESPIDFEHKQYLLFAYLQEVDNHFYKKDFSPYLLYTEQLVQNMETSIVTFKHFEDQTAKKQLEITNSNIIIKEVRINRPEEINTIFSILDFSIPLLHQRIELGRQLHKQTKSILYL